MPCPSRNPARPLTRNQRDQLAALQQARAVSRDTARGPYDGLAMCEPIVLGALRDRGLADSRVVRRPGASQFTAYWLTADGLEAAQGRGQGAL